MYFAVQLVNVQMPPTESIRPISTGEARRRGALYIYLRRLTRVNWAGATRDPTCPVVARLDRWRDTPEDERLSRTASQLRWARGGAPIACRCVRPSCVSGCFRWVRGWSSWHCSIRWADQYT